MKSKIKKIVAGILTLIVCVSTAVCVLVSCGDSETQNKTLQSNGLIIEEKQANGISLCATPIQYENFNQYAVPNEALEAVLVEYEIFPSCATTKTLSFSTTWSKEAVEDPYMEHGKELAEIWAVTADTKDYVSVVQSTNNSIIISLLDCKFAYPINLTISILNTDVSANLQISYMLRETQCKFGYIYDCSDEGGYENVQEYNGLYSGNYDNSSYDFVYMDEFAFYGDYGKKMRPLIEAPFEYDSEFGIRMPLYSAVSELEMRVVPTQNWVNVLLSENYEVFDFTNKNLVDYEIKSGLAFLVAPVVEDWARLTAMTGREIIEEYADIISLYLSTEPVYGENPLPAFTISFNFKNSVLSPKVCTAYVGFDYDSIEIPATSLTVSDENVIF